MTAKQVFVLVCTTQCFIAAACLKCAAGVSLETGICLDCQRRLERRGRRWGEGSATWGSVSGVVWPWRADPPRQSCCLCCGSVWRGSAAHLVWADREAGEDAPGRMRTTVDAKKLKRKNPSVEMISTWLHWLLNMFECLYFRQRGLKRPQETNCSSFMSQST